jgi:mannose-6-phosphate isomerase class I
VAASTGAPVVTAEGLTRGYDAAPRYPPEGGLVLHGWAPAVEALPADLQRLAVDGPAVLDWASLAGALTTALAGHGSVTVLDMRSAVLPWDEVQQRTMSPALADDPDFATLPAGSLADLLDTSALGTPPRDDVGVELVIGPGAALTNPDVLWWADLPKRYAEAAVQAGTGRNLGQNADEPPSTKRLLYIDWPLLDRHRDQFADRIDRWFDAQRVEEPASLEGEVLRATCARLARRPFRTRPTFNTTTWGGHWAQHALGHNPDAENTALGYELIAPESGVLVGQNADLTVEIPFQLIVSLAPTDMLGPEVRDVFGTSFPIRFDYLDTVGGGNLSVHCHPRPDYMSEVFGWPYTQHETYYLMVGGEQNKVFLGLRGDVSVEEFQERAHAADEHGVDFRIEDFVQTFPATAHQLFLVPAGTPHGSGEGNVVLEVSATPYLYSLRFYDWLRRDGAEQQRPVHVEHAFRNLDPTRSGSAVADHLVPAPRPLTRGDGWREDVIGSLPEMFFDVTRLSIDARASAPQRCDGRFHVLTVVDGAEVVLSTSSGDCQGLAYAETVAVPAAVGDYTVDNPSGERVRLVKAYVR